MRREPRIPGLRRFLRLPTSRVERDVGDELAFHIESRVRELVAKGEREDTARAAAEAEFGDLRASSRELAEVDRRRHRREHTMAILDGVGLDASHAVRALLRSPSFATAATLTLVIGIGASVAIFSVVNGVLLRPLPYGNPDRLIVPSHDLPSLGLYHEPQAPATYFTYQALAHTIDGIGVYVETEVNIAEPGGVGEPQRASGARFSATLIPVLEVAPAVGRAFSQDDDRPGAPPVLLIGDNMWRSWFNADPNVVGRRLDVDGISREIIGVMPAGFQFPSATAQLWIPLQLDPANPRGAYGYNAVARLRRGVTMADAQRDFATVLPRAAQVVPLFVSGISTQQMLDQMHPIPVLVPMRAEITGSIAGTLWTVAAASLLVLLVACANVANLTLVRADGRQRELAVREALGAGRARIVLHLFAESAVLSAAAAVIGLGAATIAVRLLIAASPAGVPRLTEVKIDGSTIAFTFGVAALVALSCTLFPALRLGRNALGLREGGRSATGGRAQHRLRGGLVAAQIALALVVIASSGLLLRTYQRLNRVQSGFTANRVSTLWIALPAIRYNNDTSIVQFYSQLLKRVGALPGVAAAGITSRLPLEGHGNDQNPLYPEDDPSYSNKLPPLQLFAAVDDGYFRAMGIPLIAGKMFERIDSQHEGEAIVSRHTAEVFWKDSTGAAAIGKRFRPLPTGRLYTIIGVVGDVRDTTLAGPPTQAVYFPQTFEAGKLARTKRTMALVVRTTGDRTSVMTAVRGAVGTLDRSLPLFDMRSMTEVLGAATAQLTFVMLTLAGAAMIILILGGVGLYGVLAYVVGLRTREFGIRIALGASPITVAATMTRYGLTLTAIGIVAGMAIFSLVARFLRGLLFGVAPSDAVSLGGAAILLAAIAVAASWIPARRAARIDPADALRTE